MVITHPLLSQYFSEDANAFRERDIIAPSGEILRPDRLNFRGKEVTIIDYKTGNLESSHKEQMEEYAGTLSKMGFEVKNKILVYINKEVAVNFV
jgi:CRISPR/Cas system-associated exonuclease Cas4 (RecB family)